MFKKLLYSVLALVPLCGLQLQAQDSSFTGCAFNLDYLTRMGVDAPGTGATERYTVPASFPAGAIQTCGKFALYYEDLRPGAMAAGFADPVTGATRRATFCSVLTYIQSVFDFSNIPAGKYIRLHIDTSWSNPGHSIPILLGFDHWYGANGICAPYYPKASAVGGSLINGFVHDFISAGIDPNPGDYHANLQMNFASMALGMNDFTRGYFQRQPAVPAEYYNGTGSAEPCKFDLYTNLLHLVSHSLGWFSWQDTGSVHGVSASVLPHSSYDIALAHIPDPGTTADPFSYKTKLLTMRALTPGYYLLNDKNPPYNRFVYFGDYAPFPPFGLRTEFSHLIAADYNTITRITPGDTYNPVMGLPILQGVMSREYTTVELLHFRDVIGLRLNPAFSATHTAVLGNHTPWSSRMNSDAYNFSYRSRDFAEKVAADYTLVNDIGSAVVIDLNTDPTLHDDDGDQLSVMPGTLVNFRGCSEGGNNHARLSLNSSSTTITYRPRHNFYGRASFGFNLWDGKEKGAFVIYTIEVSPGTNVFVPSGTNMIVNGDFEEGSEVKLKGSAEDVNNTYKNSFLHSLNERFGGRFNNGIILSDGHPYDLYSNHVYGTAVRNSYAECGTSVSGKPFGHPASHFPWLPSWTTGIGGTILGGLTGPFYSDGLPDAKTTGAANDRYQPLGEGGVLLNLADTMKQCKRYVLEFDTRRTFGTPPAGSTGPYSYPAERLDLDFTRTGLITDLSSVVSVSSASFPMDKIADRNWQHNSVSFTYCAPSTANVLRLRINGARAGGEYLATVLLDNVSLTEVPMALSIKIVDSATGGCNHTLQAGPVSSGCPSLTYTWRNSAGTVLGTSRVLAVSADDLESYTVTVSDGCSTATDTYQLPLCKCAAKSVFGVAATRITGGTIPSLSAGYYHLLGDVTVSGTTSFTGAKMLIEPGVTITVANNAKLTIDAAHLFVCPDTAKTWEGIRLASTGAAAGGSSGRIEVRNNSLIEDAFFAIASQYLKAPASGDIIRISQSTFNRNYIDLTINGIYGMPAAAEYPMTITSSIFTARQFDKSTMAGYPNTWPSTASLKAATTVTDAKPSYILTKTYPKALCKNGQFSAIGLELYHIGTTFGSGVAYAGATIGGGPGIEEITIFDNKGTGVNTFNSNITVLNTRFMNISERMTPTSTGSLFDGMGIKAISDEAHLNRLQVINGGVNTNNMFQDCYKGIFTLGIADLTISSTISSSSHVLGGITPGAGDPSKVSEGLGIQVCGNKNQKSCALMNNQISNMDQGIIAVLDRLPAATLTNISNNRISSANPDISAVYTTNQYVKRGLYVYCNSGPGSNTITISANTLSNVLNGIHLNSLLNTKATVSGNTVTLWDRTSASAEGQYGIQMENSSGGQVSANTISMPALGSAANADRIRGVYASFNTNLKVCSNTTTNIGRGFDFSGTRAQAGTRWVLNTINNGTKGFVLGSDIGDQAFMTSYVGVTKYYYGAGGNKWTGTWTGTNYNTFVENTIRSVNSKQYVRNIISGAVEMPGNNRGSDPRYIYTTGGATPSIFVSQSLANCDGFLMLQKPDLTPLPFTKVPGFGISLGMMMLGDLLDYGNEGRRTQWMGQLSLYELGLLQPDLKDSSAEFNDFMNAAAGSRYRWITDVQTAIANDNLSLAQSLLTNQPQAMGRAVINNDVVITDYNEADDIVNNYREYFDLYLKYAQGGMNAADSDAVDLLAQKCPPVDGAVIFQARGLYVMLTGSSRMYRDDSCAYGLPALYRTTPQSFVADNTPQGYSLYPNPNEGIFSIRQSIMVDQPMEAKVYNAVGMLISKETVQFTNGVANFKVRNVIPGLYLVCLNDESQKTICLKFNIH